MSTTSLVEKMRSIQEFESRVKSLSDKIQVEILDPFEDEDAIARIYLPERKLKDAIQDIAFGIQDRTGVWIVPMFIYSDTESYTGRSQ